MTPDQSLYPPQRTLVVGYGNPDRQDDGVASHVLDRLSQRMDRPVHVDIEDLPMSNLGADLLLQLQLTPEMVEAFVDYDQIIFVDAHISDNQPDIQVAEVRPNYQTSPLTHHMTPETCMALLNGLYNKSTDALLISIRGHKFGFTHSLSQKTSQAVDPAAEIISKRIMDDSPSKR